MLGSAQGLGALLAAPLVIGEMGRMQRSKIQLLATCGYGIALGCSLLRPSFGWDS
ncbi:MAG: hypothetical protein CM1200mP26_14880 [Acidimicrobiales bacterium]|nr:MAG: hypothetical protein CM1200mP26_14880 [Acidimicrobiales bacterium]